MLIFRYQLAANNGVPCTSLYISVVGHSESTKLAPQTKWILISTLAKQTRPDIAKKAFKYKLLFVTCYLASVGYRNITQQIKW